MIQTIVGTTVQAAVLEHSTPSEKSGSRIRQCCGKITIIHLQQCMLSQQLNYSCLSIFCVTSQVLETFNIK